MSALLHLHTFSLAGTPGRRALLAGLAALALPALLPMAAQAYLDEWFESDALKGAPDDDEGLLVLAEDWVEQLLLRGPAGLPVGPDEGDRARVFGSQLERGRK